MSLFLGLVFLPLAKQVLQEVGLTPEENRILRRLTRRRRRLVNEKTRVLNNLQADLQAVCPDGSSLGILFAYYEFICLISYGYDTAA